CCTLSQDFLQLKRTAELLFLVQLYSPEMLMSVRSIWGQHFRRTVLVGLPGRAEAGLPESVASVVIEQELTHPTLMHRVAAISRWHSH
ncbi:MAG: hypothetical protein P8Y67_13500, partial [Alphaproteobacteria bacterium]